jgi:hypothetical protein
LRAANPAFFEQCVLPTSIGGYVSELEAVVSAPSLREEVLEGNHVGRRIDQLHLASRPGVSPEGGLDARHGLIDVEVVRKFAPIA